MASTLTEQQTTMTTYKRADGDLICGEFGWVADIEYFDDDDEPTELVEEVWVRQSVRTFTKRPSNYEQCPLCGEWSGWAADCTDEHLAVLEEVLTEGWLWWQ